MKYYTNLSDSVHYNQYAAYTPKNGRQFFNYSYALQKEFETIYSSPNDGIAFTLNQIADNPVFFQNSKDLDANQISQKLFDLLVKLFREKKAFISTYKNHTVKSYAMDRTLSSWKRICDDETDDVRFVSSLVEALANINGKVDPQRKMVVHFSDNARRKAHKAVFGIDRLTMISDGNVKYGSNCVPLQEYISQTVETCTSRDQLGFYTGLCCSRTDEFNRNQETAIFLERMKKLTGVIKNLTNDQFGCYRPNDPFANENSITLGTVMQDIIQQEELLRQIYRETIDSALEKRIRNNEDTFLEKTKAAFQTLSAIEKPTRSKMYELGYPMIETFLIPNMHYSKNSIEKNAISAYAMSFFFQVIDFCYNYYNYLLSYGVQEDTQFIFYPYNTSRNKESDKLQGFRKDCIGGKIEITNDYFRHQILYRIQDTNRTTVGSYINLASAISAIKAKRNTKKETPEKKFSLVDRHGSVLPI